MGRGMYYDWALFWYDEVLLVVKVSLIKTSLCKQTLRCVTHITQLVCDSCPARSWHPSWGSANCIWTFWGTLFTNSHELTVIALVKVSILMVPVFLWLKVNQDSLDLKDLLERRDLRELQVKRGLQNSNERKCVKSWWELKNNLKYIISLVMWF